MVQAAARGALDFREIDLDDSRHRRRVRWILDAINLDNLAQIYRQQGIQFLAAVANPAASNDARKEAWEASADSTDRMIALYMPWQRGDNMQQTRASAVEQLTQQWVATWGDPTDPDVQKRIQETADWLNNTAV